MSEQNALDDHKVIEEHRCFCRFKPLLGCVIQTKAGKYKYHVRVFKSTRLYGEIFLSEGKIEVRCRDCFRLHIIKMVKDRPVIEPAP